MQFSVQKSRPLQLGKCFACRAGFEPGAPMTRAPSALANDAHTPIRVSSTPLLSSAFSFACSSRTCVPLRRARGRHGFPRDRGPSACRIDHVGMGSAHRSQNRWLHGFVRSGVQGYTASRDVGRLTRYQVVGLADGTRYCFAVQAYDNAGLLERFRLKCVAPHPRLPLPSPFLRHRFRRRPFPRGHYPAAADPIAAPSAGATAAESDRRQ